MTIENHQNLANRKFGILLMEGDDVHIVHPCNINTQTKNKTVIYNTYNMINETISNIRKEKKNCRNSSGLCGKNVTYMARSTKFVSFQLRLETA